MSIDNFWTAGGIVSIPLLGFLLLAIATPAPWHRLTPENSQRLNDKLEPIIELLESLEA